MSSSTASGPASTSAGSTPAPPAANPPAATAASAAATTAPDGPQSDAAERKRAHRAAKKAEQERRKEERKKFADETGVDPALLPPSIAGDLAQNGKVQPKGFKPREWVEVPAPEGSRSTGPAGRQVKIVSWNMLAQALVRRELFPGSDCLKGKDRLPTLMQQVLHLAPDVACLQEVDRLSEHLPSLTLTMGYTSYIGYRQKSHGLLIAHKLSVFDKVGERGIRLDDLPLDESEPLLTPPDSSTPALSASGTATPVAAETDRSAPSGQAPGLSAANGTSDPVAHLSDKEKEILARPQDATSSTGRAARTAAGLSRTTRNVALFVALAFKDDPTRGVLVATTHTFWHPLHVYERARQTALIVAHAAKFRAEVGGGRFADWPLFLAGDLNTQPRELTYRLLTDAPVPQDLLDEFERSRVVHQSVDKLYDPSYEPPTPAEPEAKEGDEGNAAGEDPDRAIKNTRPARPKDGLASFEQLRAIVRRAMGPSGAGAGAESTTGEPRGVRSAYGEAYGLIPSESDRWYCRRRPEVQMGDAPKAEESEAERDARLQGSWEERVRRGDFEPRYTNFTPMWRCTLDYILLFPPARSADTSTMRDVPRPEWRSLLSMHDFHADCEPGLPRKGIEPSDHVAIGAVVEVF